MRYIRFTVLFVLSLFIFSLYCNIGPIRFSNYHWLPADNPDYINKRYVDEEFNKGEDLLLLFQLPSSYFQRDLLNELEEIVIRIKDISNINKVNSPLHAKNIFKDSVGTLHNITYHQALNNNLLAWAQYPDHLRASPYWLRLISADYRAIALIITLDVDPDQSNTVLRQEVYQEIESIIADTSDIFQNYSYAGETELTHRIDELSKQDFFSLLPLAFLLLSCLLLLIYRRFVYVFIALIVTIASLLMTLNVNQWLGFSLNVISASLPILIMVIAIADSIHIIHRWQINISRPRPLYTSLSETWLPCLLTSLTSAIGFGVFSFSEIIPLHNFGITAFISILLSYPIIMLLSLGFLFVFNPDATAVGKYLDKRFSIVAPFIAKILSWRSVIVFLGVIIMSALVAIVPLAKTESNFLDVFFKKSSSIAKTFSYIDETLSGSGSVDIILKGSGDDAMKSITNFNNLRRLEQAFTGFDTIKAVGSMLDPVALVHKPLSDADTDYPLTSAGLAQELLFLELSRTDRDHDVLSEYVDFTYENTRIHLYTPNLKSSSIEALVNKALIPPLNTQSLDYVLTGTNIYFQRLSIYVLQTQWRSIVLTGILVWLLFMLLFGYKEGSVGALTCWVPIALILELQILLEIPFDFATVLVASICLGLCIDDTIHFLYRRRHYYGNITVDESLVATASDLFKPITVTSVLLLAGFAVLLISDLVVINRFAIFTLLAILSSLFAVFILMPAALSLLNKNKGGQC